VSIGTSAIFEGGDAAQHVRPRGRGRVAGPTPADLAAVADQLERVIAEGEPQKTKALLRLIRELRLDGQAQIQPTDRLVTRDVRATSKKWAQLARYPRPCGVIPVAARRLVLVASRGVVEMRASS
jgi:hypothetical protein